MNAEETARVLAMISTHYWQTANMANRNVDLMIETWTMALSDVPLTPYIENALDWWFKNEEWPPQASQLRERAQMYIKHERNEAERERQLAEYAQYEPARHNTSLPGLISEWNRRRKLGIPEPEVR